jgi:hypothetical protein
MSWKVPLVPQRTFGKGVSTVGLMAWHNLRDGAVASQCGEDSVLPTIHSEQKLTIARQCSGE